MWSKYFANMKHFSVNPVWDYRHSYYIIWQRPLFPTEYSPYLKYYTRQYGSCVKSWLILKWFPALWLSEFQNRMSVITAYIKCYRLQKGWLQIKCQIMLCCLYFRVLKHLENTGFDSTNIYWALTVCKIVCFMLIIPGVKIVSLFNREAFMVHPVGWFFSIPL